MNNIKYAKTQQIIINKIKVNIMYIYTKSKEQRQTLQNTKETAPPKKNDDHNDQNNKN